MDTSILIVDDEEAVRFFVTEELQRAGMRVAAAESGERALALLAQYVYDVLLLDLNLPDIGGLEVMRQTRARQPQTKTIIMTAYGTLDSAIEAVRQGARDYLQKPCSGADIVECVHRVLADGGEHAAQRDRSAAAPSAGPDTIQTGALRVRLKARRVTVARQPIPLTPTEFNLLALLACSLGEALSLETLIEDGLGYEQTDLQARETLRVHVSRLRRKLGADHIVTMRGGGYLLANFPPTL